MKVNNTKQFASGGRTYTVIHYNMAFQGHQRGEFDVITWHGGWQPVTSGKASTLAVAVAQAKAKVATA
jgi:hypothetical protein